MRIVVLPIITVMGGRIHLNLCRHTHRYYTFYLMADYNILYYICAIRDIVILNNTYGEISIICIYLPYFLLLSLTLSFPLDEVNCFMVPTNLFSSSSMSS